MYDYDSDDDEDHDKSESLESTNNSEQQQQQQQCRAIDTVLMFFIIAQQICTRMRTCSSHTQQPNTQTHTHRAAHSNCIKSRIYS